MSKVGIVQPSASCLFEEDLDRILNRKKEKEENEISEEERKKKEQAENKYRVKAMEELGANANFIDINKRADELEEEDEMTREEYVEKLVMNLLHEQFEMLAAKEPVAAEAEVAAAPAPAAAPAENTQPSSALSSPSKPLEVEVEASVKSVKSASKKNTQDSPKEIKESSAFKESAKTLEETGDAASTTKETTLLQRKIDELKSNIQLSRNIYSDFGANVEENSSSLAEKDVETKKHGKKKKSVKTKSILPPPPVAESQETVEEHHQEGQQVGKEELQETPKLPEIFLNSTKQDANESNITTETNVEAETKKDSNAFEEEKKVQEKEKEQDKEKEQEKHQEKEQEKKQEKKTLQEKSKESSKKETTAETKNAGSLEPVDEQKVAEEVKAMQEKEKLKFIEKEIPMRDFHVKGATAGATMTNLEGLFYIPKTVQRDNALFPALLPEDELEVSQYEKVKPNQYPYELPLNLEFVKGQKWKMPYENTLRLLFNNDNAVILIYMDTCPYCIEFMPTYRRLAKKIHLTNHYASSTPIVMAMVEGTSIIDKLLCVKQIHDKLGEQSSLWVRSKFTYPTIIFKRSDGKMMLWNKEIPRITNNLLRTMSEFYHDVSLEPLFNDLYNVMHEKNADFVFFYDSDDVLVPRFIQPLDPAMTDIREGNLAMSAAFKTDKYLRKGGIAIPVNNIERWDIRTPCIFDLKENKEYCYGDAAKWIIDRMRTVHRQGEGANEDRKNLGMPRINIHQRNFELTDFSRELKEKEEEEKKKIDELEEKLRKERYEEYQREKKEQSSRDIDKKATESKKQHQSRKTEDLKQSTSLE